MEIISIDDNNIEPLVSRNKRGFCAKINTRSTYSYIFNISLSIVLVVLFILVIYFFKDYLKAVLFWVETQNPWCIFVLFICLFTVVSFPVTIGYLVLIITSGYLFGILRGMGTVLISANVGVAVAHYTLRALGARLPVGRLLSGDTARAMMRVISGPQAFRIVLFARLTPIPFGIQNTIFAVSCFHSLAE